MDFGNYMPLESLPTSSRLRDPALGAGALLDVGIYTLTYASLIMGDFQVGKAHPEPSRVTSSLSVADGEWDHAVGGELKDHEVDGWYSQAGRSGVSTGWLVGIDWT